MLQGITYTWNLKKLMETRVAGGCQGQDAEETEVL